MLRPRKMKYLELTLFKNDMDTVLEYLGKKGVIQFSESESFYENQEIENIKNIIQRLCEAQEYLGFKRDPNNETYEKPQNGISENEDKKHAKALCSIIEEVKERESKTILEKQRIKETINEAKAFSKMNVPFSDFEYLSFLTLRLGRIDPKDIPLLRENLGDRAIILQLEPGGRILAACSKKGRFALDSQLKKASFEPVEVPKECRGVPAEMLKSLNEQFILLDAELIKINLEKEQLQKEYLPKLNQFLSGWQIALEIEEIKARFTTTENLYHFSGWMPADIVPAVVHDLSRLTCERVAIHTYLPNEVPSIKSGKEKVPVAMKHNAFVKGFEGVVFSYGAPLYGTIDPTAIVAFFFTLMFGIMFGDAGQGFVLLLLGVFAAKSKSMSKRFSRFSVPLISVGIASMIMGLLAGSVFTNERLLVVPTRAVTEAITGQPMDRILHILPMAGEGGSITKLFYFFGFTVSIGIIINSLGLIINIFNRCVLKKYKDAFFSKTGLAGLLVFWYALFMAVRILLGGKPEIYDFAGICIPIFFIFFGDLIWRVLCKKKPVMENGILAFAMEGFVEVLDTVSTYFSNTVSFLRVGAFALAHAVFSFIVFHFTDELAMSGAAGTFSAVLVMIIGNVIIIILEGLIVAIQVVRLQYYEFFNKFFIETGVEFSPFRFGCREKAGG